MPRPGADAEVLRRPPGLADGGGLARVRQGVRRGRTVLLPPVFSNRGRRSIGFFSLRQSKAARKVRSLWTALPVRPPGIEGGRRAGPAGVAAPARSGWLPDDGDRSWLLRVALRHRPQRPEPRVHRR